MVSKNQPHSLPSGWKLLIKLKTSGKYKCYVHSKTGLKVYSRLAVLRCIKNGSVGNDSFSSPKKPAKKSTDREKQETNWLPAGWTEEVKVPRSGGRTYMCYTDPSSGSKFYSKPEVLRHLQSTQNVGPSGHEERRSTRHSSSNVQSTQNNAGHSGHEERRSTRHSLSNRPIDRQKCQELTVKQKASHDSKAIPSSRLSTGIKERPVNQRKAQESNIEQNMLQNSNSPAGRRRSLRNKEIPVDERKAHESIVEQNMLQNSSTPATRRLSSRNKEMPVDHLKAPESKVEQIMPQNSNTPASRRRSLRNKEMPVDHLKAEESNVEQIVLQNSNTPTSRRLSLRNKEMPVDHLKAEESNVEQIVLQNSNTPTSRRLSLRNKEMPVDHLKAQESKVEQIMLQNSNTPASRRLSLRSKERPVEQQKALDPNVKPSSSQNSKTTVVKSFSSGKKKIVIESTVDKDLPSGWIKEMRKRFNGTQVRADPFYSHPAVGLVFRSKLEVLRYLNTGEISRHAYRRRNNADRKDCTTEKTSPTLPVKGKTPTKRKTRTGTFASEETPRESPSSTPEIRVVKEVTVGRTTRSSSSRLEPASMSEAKVNQSSLFHETPNISKETMKTETNGQKITPSTPATSKLTVEDTATCSMEPCSNEEPQTTKKKTKDQKLTPSTPATSKLRIESTAACPMKGCSNKKAQTTKRKTNDQKMPFRSSKRLAGVEVHPVFLSIPIEHVLRPVIQKSEEPKPIASSVSVLNDLQDKPNPPDTNMQPTEPSTVDTSPETVLATEEPLSTSASLMPSSPPAVSENALIDVVLPNTDQPSEISTNHPILDPPLDVFPPPEVEFSFPLPLWSDPCLEFAYKTLTGALPLDDNLAIEDYIQHQLRTTKPHDEFQSLPDIDMPSFLQNDETKHSQLPDINMPDGVTLTNGDDLPPPTKQPGK